MEERIYSWVKSYQNQPHSQIPQGKLSHKVVHFYLPALGSTERGYKGNCSGTKCGAGVVLWY